MKDDRTLFQLLETAPAQKACLVFNDTIITYGQFRDQVLRVAGGLSKLGVRRGDVVGIWLPNTPEWLVSAFACARLGAYALSLNLRYAGREVAEFIQRSGCKVLLYTPEYRGRDYRTELSVLPIDSRSSLKQLISAQGAQAPFDHIAETTYADLLCGESDTTATGRAEDGCIVVSSSGTTSKPKLIAHSQGRVARHSHDVTQTFELDMPDVRLLLGIPLCGAFGYTVAMGGLAAGATLVMMETFEPKEAARLFNAENITHAFGTNDMLEKVLDAGGAEWRPTHLRMYGHANFTPGLTHLPERAQRQGVFMQGCFGMSETMALFATQPHDGSLERRSHSGGHPIAPGAQVRVRDLDSGQLLGPGQTGELELLHPDIMLGYLGDAVATENAFTADGFLKTGDLGYLNEDGGFTHLSRIGDVLRIGGYLVNPLEIEEALLHGLPVPTEHIPTACQVVEVEAHGSARPVAFVTGSSDYVHDEAVLIRACQGRLAKFKIPIRVLHVTEFPTTSSPNGFKVIKSALREIARKALQSNEGLPS